MDESEIDNLDESARQNLMVNADGDYVLAQSDEKAWKKFQEQQQAQGEAQKSAKAGNQELQELGLECSIDKRLFVDPMKTPCCGRTYCHDCIENALIDNDLQCPGCQTENVSLEGLTPDEETKTKIKAFQEEKKSQAGGSVAGSPRPAVRSSVSPSPQSPSSIAGRKRTASEVTNNEQSNSLATPAMKRQKSGDSVNSNSNGNGNSINGNQSSSIPPPQQTNMPNMPNMPNMMIPPNMMAGMPFNPMMNPMMMGMMGMNGMNMNMPMPMPNMGMMPNMNLNMNGFMPSPFPMNNMMGAGGYNNRNNHRNSSNSYHRGGGGSGNTRGNGWRPKNQYSRTNNSSNVNNNDNNKFAAAAAPDLSGIPKGPKSMQNAVGTSNSPNTP